MYLYFVSPASVVVHHVEQKLHYYFSNKTNKLMIESRKVETGRWKLFTKSISGAK
jgi:hypothetical protein